MKNEGVCMRVLALAAVLCMSIGSAAADQAAEEFMESTWRAYRTMPSSSVVINTRTFDQDGSVQKFSRFIVFWSQRGGIRINTPSCTWVHDGGKAYGSNAYFPGCFQAKVVGSNSGKALEAMDAMWPGLELPLDVHIRMANSWQEAFKSQIEQSGPDGTTSIEATSWQEGIPSILLTFKSLAGDYEEKIWFDATNSTMYGHLQRTGKEGSATFVGSQSLTEATSNADRQIRFAVASREEFSNFTDLSNTFTSNFSIPTPAHEDAPGDPEDGSSIR